MKQHVQSRIEGVTHTLSSVSVGTSHPIWMLASPWRILMAFATGFMVLACSLRNVISAGVNLSKHKWLQTVKLNKSAYFQKDEHTRLLLQSLESRNM